MSFFKFSSTADGIWVDKEATDVNLSNWVELRDVGEVTTGSLFVFRLEVVDDLGSHTGIESV